MCLHTDLLGLLKVDLTIVLPSLKAIVMINSVQDIYCLFSRLRNRFTFLLVTSTFARLPDVVLNEVQARFHRCHLP